MEKLLLEAKAELGGASDAQSIIVGVMASERSGRTRLDPTFALADLVIAGRSKAVETNSTELL